METVLERLGDSADLSNRAVEVRVLLIGARRFHAAVPEHEDAVETNAVKPKRRRELTLALRSTGRVRSVEGPNRSALMTEPSGSEPIVPSTVEAVHQPGKIGTGLNIGRTEEAVEFGRVSARDMEGVEAGVRPRRVNLYSASWVHFKVKLRTERA